jgi:TRAP-type C4-dicarboxylate transport system permease small subunit
MGNREHSLKAVYSFCLDVVEEYIPMTAFLVLFGSFILQIFCRYFLVPLTWPLELTLLCFIWVALLGGLYAKRTDSHVAFSMVYDAVGPGVQLFMRLVGNAMLFTAFCLALYPSYDYVMFMGFKKSNVLKIPMDLAFFPFLVYLVFMLGRVGRDILDDIIVLFSRGGDK